MRGARSDGRRSPGWSSMTADVGPSHRIAERVLGDLKKVGLSATPRNFEVWYAHVEGLNPALSRDIQAATDMSGNVSQKAADKLYRTHIQHADLSRDVIDLVTRFRDEVSELHEMIEQSSESAVDHNETLKELSGQLRQTTKEYPAVSRLLEGVIAVAKDMRNQNEQLELRLADSVSEINSLQHSVENIQAEAMKDPLTGIANRSVFDKSLQRHMSEAGKANEPLSLVLADIDHFKNFNDQWGHQTGDQVLRLVAEVMLANVKGQDILARYGGEEFAIILPNTTLKNAHTLADRIRRAVQSRHLKKRRTSEDLGVVTMSMGVAQHRKADTVETFIDRADQSLYAAKADGRNKVLDESVLNAKSSGASPKSGAA